LADAGKITIGIAIGSIVIGAGWWAGVELTAAKLIYPKKFDWGAFSTLVTGGLAVAGAIWVGLKQTKIQKLQTEIAYTTMRAEMYDRRIIVYSQVRAFAGMVWQDPSREKKEIYRNFFVALESSKFLFDDAVYDIANRIFHEMNSYNSADALLNIEGYHIPDTLKRHTVSGDKIWRLIKEFEDAAAPLMKIEDMKLP
jgi:hypothetical protein